MGLVRLFLAWVVVIDHWYVMTPAIQVLPFDDRVKFGFNAGYAVMFFYVISGFLITYALSRKYGDDFPSFYKARFIRIFSLYWPLVLVAFLVLPGAWAEFVSGSVADKATGLLLLGMDWRVAFASYPEYHWAAAIKGLAPAWTLGAELTFYLMAPLLMRSWKIGAVLLVMSLGARALVVTLHGSEVGMWSYQFFPATLCFFLLGHLACLVRWKPGPRFSLALLACSFAVMTVGPRESFDNWRLWLSVVCFAAALPGLFEASKNVRWMNLLGDLSYPVYLVHMVFILLVGVPLAALIVPAFPPALGGYGSAAVVVGIVTVVAAAVHWVLEKPVAHAMRMAAFAKFAKA